MNRRRQVRTVPVDEAGRVLGEGGAFSTELFASQRRNGIYASSEFVFPLLASLMVEQTVRRLDSDVDFQAIARPIVFRAASRPAGERRRRLESVD